MERLCRSKSEHIRVECVLLNSTSVRSPLANVWNAYVDRCLSTSGNAAYSTVWNVATDSRGWIRRVSCYSLLKMLIYWNKIPLSVPKCHRCLPSPCFCFSSKSVTWLFHDCCGLPLLFIPSASRSSLGNECHPLNGGARTVSVAFFEFCVKFIVLFAFCS